MSKVVQWITDNRVLLLNAGSLIGTTAITSGLGFVYWWMAARLFVPDAVGIASAIVSTMVLLGTLAVLGMGTLLITELPRQPKQAGALISMALLVVGSIGTVLGVVFALIAPLVSANFAFLHRSVFYVLLFAVGVSTTAITQVLDQALIGLLRGGLQLYRNTLFALAKLLLVFCAGSWFIRHRVPMALPSSLPEMAGMVLYATWPLGNLLSLVLFVPLLLSKQKKLRSLCSYLPQWVLLRKLGLTAIQHHLLNLALQLPSLLLPVLVTMLLSAKMNAWFYVSWMIANFVFLVPTTLTIVLHAVNSAQQATLTQKARMTALLGLGISLLATLLLQVAPQLVLRVFGAAYVGQASWCLRILVLAAFPLLIKNHYISICRIEDRISQAMIQMLPWSLLELCAAVLGAHVGALVGLSSGWLIAICTEALFQFPPVYRVISGNGVGTVSSPMGNRIELEAAWLSDTLSLPVLLPSSQSVEAIWLRETMKLPVFKQGTKHITTLAPTLVSAALPLQSPMPLEWRDRGGQFRPWPTPVRNE